MSDTTAVSKREMVRSLPGSLNNRCRLTVTMGGTRGWHTIRGMFLSDCEASQTFRATIEANPNTPPESSARPGDAVGVTYRDGKRKCIFSAPFVSMACDATGGEIVLGWPATVHHLRRRAFERVTPPHGRSLAVRLRSYDGCASSNIVPEVSDGRLLDISVGGLRIAVADSRRFELGMTYRCSFTPHPDRAAIAFDANVLHCGTGDDGQPVVGLQIVGRPTSTTSIRPGL